MATFFVEFSKAKDRDKSWSPSNLPATRDTKRVVYHRPACYPPYPLAFLDGTSILVFFLRPLPLYVTQASQMSCRHTEGPPLPTNEPDQRFTVFEQWHKILDASRWRTPWICCAFTQRLTANTFFAGASAAATIRMVTVDDRMDLQTCRRTSWRSP